MVKAAPKPLPTRKLFLGDNLQVLRESITTESVDLIYLDPPFNSAADYNVLFRDQGDHRDSAQVMAFTDTWHWGPDDEQLLLELTQINGDLARFLSDTAGLPQSRATLGSSSGTYGGRLEEPRFHRQTLLA